MRVIVALLLCTLPLLAFSLGTTQSAAATAKLLCNGKPYKDARIKFYEEDIGPGQDDLLMEVFSTAEGTFKVQGNETEIGSITPKVNIYHNCNDENVECWRKITVYIPKDYISEGEIPEKTFSIGILNLDAKLPGETRDCLN